MPQTFQVLKCFKCAVFQVHQMKKSNKFQCKLCGEKQSIKRHYGVGTAKECRLHVQKLNGIRGEIDESVENFSDTDEEPPVQEEKVSKIIKSKWSDFVVEEDSVKPDPEEDMYLGNAEVVLERPSKRKKFVHPKAKTVDDKRVSTNSLHDSYKDSNYNFEKVYSVPKINCNVDYATECKVETQKTFLKKANENKFVPPKVDKQSKWAQFTDENQELQENIELADIESNSSVVEESLKTLDAVSESPKFNDTKNLGNSFSDKVSNNNNIPVHNTVVSLFSTCDENDLDDILNI